MKIISGWRSSKYLARFGIFLIIIALITGIPVSYGVSGNQPSQNLEIYTWYDLDEVRDNLDGDHILMNDLNATTYGYEELASPAANGRKGWEPIGFVDDNIPAPSIGCGQPVVADEPIWRHGLTGTFDGQGYKICDLFINRPDESNVGLFRFVVNGYIENIDMVNAIVIGKDRVGALVGSHHGIVVNSYSSASVTGTWMVGGLVGKNGIVSNSYSTGNVTGILDVGGLVGFNNLGTVTNSYSSAYVTGEHGVGGLVGWNGWGTVTNSYSSAYVTGEYGVGGLVGRMDLGSVSNSYYNYNEVLINGENIITTGALFDEDFNEWLTNDKFLDINDRLSQESGYYVVNNIADFKELLAFGQNSSLKFRLKSDLNLATEPNLYIPYLAGEFDGNGHRISDLSLNLNPVSPLGLFGWLTPGGKITDLGVEDVNITGLDYVGGLVGRTRSGNLSRCYSTGSVTGDMYVGGLMGENMLGTISNSYSTSDITGRLLIGGLVGYNQGSVSSCYSTGTVNGEEEVGGLVGHSVSYSDVSNSFWNTETSGQPTSDGGTGKTTAEMKNIATFSGATWDIIAVANLSIRNPSYIWNIVNGVTYPFLSWERVS